MIIFRGEDDTAIDSNLRTSSSANAQGRNRFERAKYMYDFGRRIVSSSPWQLIDVPNCAHSSGCMARAAQAFLVNAR
jgi:hypothetical protein